MHANEFLFNTSFNILLHVTALQQSCGLLFYLASSLAQTHLSTFSSCAVQPPQCTKTFYFFDHSPPTHHYTKWLHAVYKKVCPRLLGFLKTSNHYVSYTFKIHGPSRNGNDNIVFYLLVLQLKWNLLRIDIFELRWFYLYN